MFRRFLFTVALLLNAIPGFSQNDITDPDFAVQGEYAGTDKGLQVIALGNGEFELVLYAGGLPGAGWDRQEPRRFEGDADVVEDLLDSLGLKRVERSSPTIGAKPPVNAIVLFDGTETSLRAHWKRGLSYLLKVGFKKGRTRKISFKTSHCI